MHNVRHPSDNLKAYRIRKEYVSKIPIPLEIKRMDLFLDEIFDGPSWPDRVGSFGMELRWISNASLGKRL